MPRPIAGAPLPAHGDTLLAQSAFGSLPPVDRASLGAGHRLQALISPRHGAGGCTLVTHPEVGAHPTT
jgi:hypothetical protein